MPWFELCLEADLSPGESHEFVAEGRVIAIYNVDGELVALDGVCPHQGGPLGKGKLSGCIVTCPWHGWQFDVRNGQSQLSPGVRQDTIPTKIADGRVSVQLGTREE